jgi:hypothetical protein
MASGDARAVDLKILHDTVAEEPLFQRHKHTHWHNHWKGWGNGITDYLSRDNLLMAFRLAHAFGIKLVEAPLNAEVQRMLHRVEVRTRPPPERHFPVEVVGIDGKRYRIDTAPQCTVGDIIERYLVEASMEHVDMFLKRQGKVLQPDDLVGYCGVVSGDTLHCSYRARCGMRTVSDAPAPMRKPTSEDTSSSAEGMREVGATSSTPRRPSPRVTLPPQPTFSTATPLPPASAINTSVTDRRTQGMREVTEESPGKLLRAGSPQPLSATAARQAAAGTVATRLAANQTEYALCATADDENLLFSLAAQMHQAKMSGIPRGTVHADNWGFGWAVSFGKATGTRWMRPRADTKSIDLLTERYVAAAMLFWFCMHMRASAKRAAEGYDKAKPSSALLALYGYRRVLRDCDRYVADMTQVCNVLKGICAMYKQEYGPDAFKVDQAALFTLTMLRAIAAACAKRTVPTWSASRHRVWGTIHSFEASTGTRKDEWTFETLNDDGLKRSNFWWIEWLADEYLALPMTEEVIASRTNGSLLCGESAPSKCDRLNIRWSKQKQYFRLDDSDPLNFAYWWQQYEIEHPCPMHLRTVWPAFSPTGDDKAFASAAAATQHRHLLTIAIGPDAAAMRTIHSYRGSLISALFAWRKKGHKEITDGVMQLHVRWKTLEAMLSYAKITPDDFADNVVAAVNTDAGTSMPATAPVIEPHAALEEAEAIVQSISRTSAAASTAIRTVKELEAAAASDAPSTPKLVQVVGSDKRVKDLGADSWELVGTDVELPNSLWDEDDGGTIKCRVTHFIGRHHFARGGTHVAYTVAFDEESGNYAVRAGAILRHLPAALRTKLRKQPNPVPLAA